MNSHIRKYFVFFLALLVGLLWLEAHGAKPEKITVTEAIPSEALQGEDLPVRIKGSGFGPGSTAKFLVTGTQDDTQIDVGTVIYDEATGDLVAEIQVLDQALVIEYDIEVRSLSGRRGKGTTLFAVRKKDDGVFTADDVYAALIYNDGEYGPYDMEEASAYHGPYPNAAGEQHHPFGAGWDTWVENTLTAIPRTCTGESVSQLGNPASAGHYFCDEEHASGGRISLELAGTDLFWEDVTPGKKQKYPGFCRLLNVWDTYRPGEPVSFGVTHYAFVFQDGCTPGQCPFDLFTSSYSGATSGQGYFVIHPFRNLTDLPSGLDGQPIAPLPDVGPLAVRVFLDTSFVQFPADPELNVFTVPQYLPVRQFQIEFKKITAPGAAMAVCQTAVDHIWFVTEPK